MSDFERTDFNQRRVLQITGAFAVLLVGIVFTLSILESKIVRKEMASKNIDAKLERSEVTPQKFDSFESGEDVERVDREQRRVLESYGWVSKSKKIVHVPIERAMSILVPKHE